MTDFFVDHGAYATAIGATPTWGVPQEGDGSSKDAATASSIASIAFGSVPTTGTFSCCGVSISTTGVLGAATVTAAADTLASNINAVSSTVASGVAVGTPQLRNLVYARGPTNGAPAGTCEIMMRVGSTALNYSTNSNAALASTFDGTPTVVQFAGGSGGCWGYLLNAAAMGVSSSIASLAYGVMFGQPYVWTATPTIEDTIWARTGSGKSITVSTSSQITISRNRTWSMRLLFDANAVWTGDSGTGVALIDLTSTYFGDISVCFQYVGSTQVSIAAMAKGGLRIKANVNAGSNSASITSGNAADHAVLLTNVDFEDATTFATSGMTFGAGNAGVFTLRGCRFYRLAPQATLKALVNLGYYYCSYMRFEGCSFQWNISGVGDPGPIVSLGSLGSGTLLSLTFSGCDFSGWASGGDKFTFMAATTTTVSGVLVAAENCTGLKLTSTYSGLIQTTGSLRYDPAASASCLMQSGDSAQFRYEQRNGLVEWDAEASPAYPTLSAVQLDGATPWSLKALWLNNGEVLQCNELKVVTPSLVYRGAAATKTITLEMFCRSALISALDRLKVCMMVSYVSNTTGKVAMEILQAVPSSSSASWTGAGSWSGYAAYKVALTTAAAVKPNTEIKLQLRLHGKPNAGQNENVFIDPEFSIT